MAALWQVERLSVELGGRRVVDGVSLSVEPGECLALVGESGAGKTLTALSALGLLPGGARATAERFELAGEDMLLAAGGRLDRSERRWRPRRGARVALVSQDALVALDPLRRVGAEVAEPLEVHRMARGRRDARQRAVELLARVAVPEPAARARQRPHELSGGLRQRALIASAIAAEPVLLVADEPTTALDATVQARVLDLLARLKREGLGILLVSHDLAAVSAVADRVAVMREGRVVEAGPTRRVLARPEHPFTRALLAAAPQPVSPRPPGDRPVLAASGLRRSYRGPGGATLAVDGVGLSVDAGRTLGIVGESGSGKSTLARLLLAVERPDAGEVLLEGEPWSALPERRRRPRRGRIQLVDQDAFGALDPRWRVERILGEALALDGLPPARHRARALELLDAVGLGPEHLRRRPAQLSGGQRQRVAIARALAREPAVLVCDEPVSALDATVQAQVLALLREVQGRTGVAIVLVSHDLAVVAAMADEVLVMREGRVVERGPADRVLSAPEHPFTRALVAAAAPPAPAPPSP